MGVDSGRDGGGGGCLGSGGRHSISGGEGVDGGVKCKLPSRVRLVATPWIV